MTLCQMQCAHSRSWNSINITISRNIVSTYVNSLCNFRLWQASWNKLKLSFNIKSYTWILISSNIILLLLVIVNIPKIKFDHPMMVHIIRSKISNQLYLDLVVMDLLNLLVCSCFEVTSFSFKSINFFYLKFTISLFFLFQESEESGMVILFWTSSLNNNLYNNMF